MLAERLLYINYRSLRYLSIESTCRKSKERSGSKDIQLQNHLLRSKSSPKSTDLVLRPMKSLQRQPQRPQFQITKLDIKTMDLFSKAKEALSNSGGHNTRDQPREKPSKPREIQPMQKRTGILHRGKDIKLPLEDPTSPNMSVRSPTTKIEIPFSKNRYSKEANNEELTQENNKKAIKYLKSQKATRKEKEQKKKSLLEKRKLYNEQVRKLNKERLQKRRRNSSIEDTRERRGRQPTAPRSKSEDVQTKSHKVVRKYARNRLRQINRSEAKPTEGYLEEPKSY